MMQAWCQIWCCLIHCKCSTFRVWNRRSDNWMDWRLVKSYFRLVLRPKFVRIKLHQVASDCMKYASTMHQQCIKSASSCIKQHQEALSCTKLYQMKFVVANLFHINMNDWNPCESSRISIDSSLCTIDAWLMRFDAGWCMLDACLMQPDAAWCVLDATCIKLIILS